MNKGICDPCVAYCDQYETTSVQDISFPFDQDFHHDIIPVDQGDHTIFTWNEETDPSHNASLASSPETNPKPESRIPMGKKDSLLEVLGIDELESPKKRPVKVHWTDSPAFGNVIGIAVLLNALQLGLELDVNLGVFWVVCENVFCALWTFEMVAKILAHGPKGYFKDPWNLLDFGLATMTIVDVWILQYMVKSGSGGLKGVSVLRVMRLARLVRLVKTLRAFEELWLLVNGMIQAFSLLTWVFVLLAIITYVGAIFVTSIIGKSCDDDDVPEEFSQCHDWFGNVLSSMMTLFQIITGDSWSTVTRAVITFHPAMIIFFLLFMLITSFGLMNIVMGIIVEQTIQHAHQNDEKVEKLKEIQQAKELGLLKTILDNADQDGSGSVTLDEFVKICERSDVQKMFKDLDLPVNRERLARRVFEVLDGSSTGEMQIQEMLSATVRLKHEGKHLHQDQTLLLMETRHLARRLTRMEKVFGIGLQGQTSAPSGLATSSDLKELKSFMQRLQLRFDSQMGVLGQHMGILGQRMSSLEKYAKSSDKTEPAVVL